MARLGTSLGTSLGTTLGTNLLGGAASLPAIAPAPLIANDPQRSLNTILFMGYGPNNGSGSAAFSDQCFAGSGNAWTTAGDTKFSNAATKFGPTSLLFDGTGDFLTGTRSSCIGTGDFTIEAWLRIASLASDGEIFCISDPSGTLTAFDLVFEYKTTGALRGSIQDGGGNTNVDITSATGLLAINTWYHVAFTAEGTTARLRIDGAVVATGTITGTRVNNRATVKIGKLTDSGSIFRYVNGYLDSLRVTKACRYPGASTVTPAAFVHAGVPVFTSRVSVSATGGANDEAQCVAVNSTHIWMSTTSKLYKYTIAGALVTSRDVTADLTALGAPLPTGQINGLFLRSGKLYASVANYASSTGTSMIVEYDPDTLTYGAVHPLSGNFFSEGMSYAHGSWWVAFHATLQVNRYDDAWNLQAVYPLSYAITGANHGYGPDTGYESAQWVDGCLYCNLHEVYGPRKTDVYAWDGAAFVQAARITQPSGKATQGLTLAPDGTLWYAERNGASNESALQTTLY